MMQRLKEIMKPIKKVTAGTSTTHEQESIKESAESRLRELERLAYLRGIADVYDYRDNDDLDSGISIQSDISDSDAAEGVG